MVNQIPPLAQLFRGMADLIDRDHTSQTPYEAITKAAGVAATHATTQQLVAGPLWETDGAGLLAAAYAFHAGLSRQAATATHIRALVQTSSLVPGGKRALPEASPGRTGSAAGPTVSTVPPARASSPPVDPRRLPGPRLNDLDPADQTELWTALSELRRGEVVPRGQLIRLTSWLPTDLAARLLALLSSKPALVRADAARLRDAIDFNDPTTPVLAVVTLGWLEAAEQVLASGSTAHDLQVLLSVAGRRRQPP